MFFWLPMLLKQKPAIHFDNQISDNVSILYDVGGILGGFLGGAIVDRFGKYGPIMSGMGILSLAPITTLMLSKLTVTDVSIIVFIAGIFMNGPCNVISSAIASDLGKTSLKDNTEAVGTVTGLLA